MFQEGQQIGLYTLIRKLGKGGFGEVWLAERKSKFVTTKVAVKLPHDEQIDHETIKQEAQLWEQASGHPNILPIIDADEYDGQIVIVSEYAPDGSLDEWLKRNGKMPVEKAVEMTIKILDGLEFLHSRNIIHRDLKPANILLQGNTPRLADFGISRALRTTVASQSRNISGTFAYMPPEGFDGKRSVQTDVWSVGVNLYQFLTGTLPFPNKEPSALIAAIMMREFEPLPADIPNNLQNVIAKALAKQPENRYASASEMREDLRRVLQGNFQPTPRFVSSQIPLIEPSPKIIESSIDSTNPNPIISGIRVPIENNEVETVIFKAENTQPEKNKQNKTFLNSPIAITFGILLLIGVLTAGYFVYQKFAVSSQVVNSQIEKNSTPNLKILNRITKEDMTILLKDANLAQLKAIGASPEEKKKVVESLRQLLAVASQAKKDGLAEDPNVKHELESIRSLITASLYDKKINTGKAQMPPFSFITKDQVKEFWSGGDATRRKAEFKQFLDAKTALARESGKFPMDKELGEEEIKQAKDDFAKVKIYEEEAAAKRGELGEEFNRELELQVELQQAQFLATTYAQKTLVEKIKVSDDDVKNYIASHPEFDTKDKRAKAEQVLSRAKAGEDFGKLAKEFSEDPGSKDKGGLYKDVAVNSGFDKNFESAALALEPGQITENLVETPFGFHIIKLEKKGEGKDPKGEPTQTYDVRHILFGTTIADPENPKARPMPISVKVKTQLEEEKQKQVLDEIVANNPIEIAEDFIIPRKSK